MMFMIWMCELHLSSLPQLLERWHGQMKDTDLRNDSKTGEYKPVNGTTYYANTGITKGSAYAQEAVSCLLPHPPSPF